MTFAEILRNWPTDAEVIQWAGDIINDNSEAMADLNRRQLLRGQDNEGETLRPLYTEDSFFKTRQAAQRYADWKQTLNPEAPYNAPTLFINGEFHSTIKARANGDEYVLYSNSPKASDIDRKYRGKHLGLNEDSRRYYKINFIQSGIVQRFANKTGFKITSHA